MGAGVKVILIQSCSLDPNASLVTIFLGRALLTFIITEVVTWAEAEGRWRTVLSLGAGIRQRRRWRSRKLVRGDRRKEGRKELFAHLEAFLHIVFLSYSWPPRSHLLRTSSKSPPFLSFLLPGPFLARNARNVFHPPTSNRSTLRNFLVHVQGALTPHRQRNGEERKELKKLKTYATANIKDETHYVRVRYSRRLVRCFNRWSYCGRCP